MPKEEIKRGIERAIEGGQDLESAKQSFLNAGYNEDEVRKAVRELRGIIERVPSSSQEIGGADQNNPEPPNIQTSDSITREQLPPRKSQGEAPKNNSKAPSPPSPEKEGSNEGEKKKLEPKKLPSPEHKKEKRDSKMKTFIVILTILLLLAIVGIALTLVFKDQVLDLLQNLF